MRSTYWMPAALNAAIATKFLRRCAAVDILKAVRTEVAARHELVREILDGVPFVISTGALNLWLKLRRPGARLAFAASTRARNVIVGYADAFVVGDRAPPEAVRIGIGTVLTRNQLQRGLCVVRDTYRGM